MKKKIAVLPGDGIGPEIVEQAVKALKSIEKKFQHEFELEYGLIGAAAIDATGNPYPDKTHALCTGSDAILFGAIGDPKYDNDPSAKIRPEQGLLKMRSALGLYANIRPVKSYDALLDASPLKTDRVQGVDFVVVRELISGIYFGKPRGRSEDQSIAYDTCVYTREEILRITEKAFQFAKNRKKKVTLLDKANVLATSRLWREVVTEYAKNHPDIELECNYIDSAAMEVITKPKKFDVILTENLFGDIISDEASVIAGSLGILPSASIGSTIGLYEPIHGSYPQAAGKNIANPMATILSAAMLLEYSFGMLEESNAIVQAVDRAMQEGFVTEDINNGQYSTSAVGDKIAEFILA
ncbi:MAG TPA: 3-isopropylmalate dehydrogenase [Chitinophagales bacterium]|nr:3-isopropylmalate dehydrogenase [Chitinophagales bacterium]HQO31520.1 3-isopropylmalate dehydrogenase [Chitinophagales bacterium]